jgi:membrane protein YdbS with pleckstrin-like domain
MPDNIICPRCSKPTPDARFCKHCGGALYTCIACGAKVTTDSKFCPECGVELPLMPSGPASEAAPKAYARYGKSLIPKNMLIEGEEPLFETRPVLWLSLMPPIAFIMIGVGVLIAVYLQFQVKAILYACGGIAFIGAVWVCIAWLRWRYTIFGATNRRILRQTGIVSKTYLDFPLAGVSNIYLDISLWGRMNGFGTVRITGAGTQIVWENIDDPKEAHRLLNEIVEQYRRQKI